VGSSSSAICFFIILGGEALHAGQAGEHGGHRAGVAGQVDVQVIDLALGDDVEAPEGEEDERVDARLARGVGEDEGGIGLVEASVRADDRDLAVGVG
jgi:hypothetical protein